MCYQGFEKRKKIGLVWFGFVTKINSYPLQSDSYDVYWCV